MDEFLIEYQAFTNGDPVSSYRGNIYVMQDVHAQDMQDILDLVGDIADLDDEEFLAMLEHLPDLPVDVNHRWDTRDMPDFIEKTGDVLNSNAVLETNAGYYAG